MGRDQPTVFLGSRGVANFSLTLNLRGGGGHHSGNWGGLLRNPGTVLANAIASMVDARGVIVYERVSTSLYSKRMLESFGLEGAVRVSPLHCNSPADVDRFLQVTYEIAEVFYWQPMF